ncbi:MAG: aminotransferase class V-fold PLP-dependent enzyme, partial [Bradymonadaceae bacterium]
QALQEAQGKRRIIGSFSAASNVTGIGTDTRATAALLHRHGALSFWDFAAAGPYVKIEMNMKDDSPDGHLIYKDAVFLSPHKFIGGPGTPGLLIIKRRLLENRVPTAPGGGTVAYVNTSEHRYLDCPIHREEGGTPAIIGSIRAGLVFQLKEAVGVDLIREKEFSFERRAIESWSKNSNIRILGNLDAWRLSIISFIIRHHDRYLHHNYVVALLNDLLGIQARGGCSCAGPYGHRLLGIDLETSKEFEREIVRGCEGIKPGWVRVNFNYFISETAFEFLLEGIHLVATHGWKLLPHYRFDPDKGTWHHRLGRPDPALKLGDITYVNGKPEYRVRHATEPESTLGEYIAEARRIFDTAGEGPGEPLVDPPLSDDFQVLRWFPLPAEIQAELSSGQAPLKASTHALGASPHASSKSSSG